MIMDRVDQSSCVPPGFRFHPTDEELLGYYLRKKVATQRIDLNVIRDIDLYRLEPWDLIERCQIGYAEKNEWYFFSHKDKKYPMGTRMNRATITGFWKATGRDKAVYEKQRLIGMRKTLVFYKGRAPNGQKTDWIMHEYRLESEENGPPQEEGWVVCRAFKKRVTGQTRTQEWESNSFHNESSHLTPVIEDYITTRSPNFLLTQNLTCKHEYEATKNLDFVHCDQFIQLPQLESPIKKLSSISKNDQEDDQTIGRNTNYSNSINNSNSVSNDARKVRDWRALDKFVASQLSQEKERFGQLGEGFSLSFEGNHDSDHCDIGICIFDT